MSRFWWALTAALALLAVACGDDGNKNDCDPEQEDCTAITPPDCEGDDCTQPPPCTGENCTSKPPALGPTFEWGEPGVDYPTKEEMEAAGIRFFPKSPFYSQEAYHIYIDPEPSSADTLYDLFLDVQQQLIDKYFRTPEGKGKRFPPKSECKRISEDHPLHDYFFDAVYYSCYLEKVVTAEEFDAENEHFSHNSAEAHAYGNRWLDDYAENFPRIVEHEFFCQTGVVRAKTDEGLPLTVWQWTPEGRLLMHPGIRRDYACVQTPYGAGFIKLPPYSYSSMTPDASFTGYGEPWDRGSVCHKDVDWLAWTRPQYEISSMAAPTAYTKGTLEDAYNPVSDCQAIDY